MMNIKNALSKFVAFGALASFAAAPMTVNAQSLGDLNRLIDRRQQKKNEWRNIAIAAGAVGVLGLLKKDNTLTFAGAAGALYSLHRYEQDRKSQSSLARARAAYFTRGSFVRNGQRYVRRSTTRNGKKYYYFAKAR